MEIKYPIIILISVIVFFVFFFLNKDKKEKVRNKNKIANTSIIKNTSEFKNIIKKYRFFLYFIYVLVFICVLSSSLLSSRIVEEKTISNEIYNRDIMLCMDVSGSVIELDADLINTYLDVVKGLKGERFGISIFNTSSVLILPLTDDYEYINDTLINLAKGMDLMIDYDSHPEFSTTERIYYSEYIYYGTTVGSKNRGSSLTGDGLASCIYDFPNLDEKRSRVIIYSTDNEVAGTEYINVTDAAKLAKKKNITVHAINPSNSTYDYDNHIAKLKDAAKITGGNYYVYEDGKTVSNVINEIEKQEKSILKGPVKTSITDYPSVPLLITIISFIGLIVIDKVVLS